MKKKEISNELKALIADDYVSGMSLNDLVIKYKVFKPRLKQILVERNIPLRSKAESMKLRQKKTETILLSKYGVTNAYQIDTIAKKAKKAFQDNKEQVIAKCKQTKLNNHGDENYNNIEQIISTRVENYGIINFFQDEEIHTKAITNATSASAKKKKEETCLEKFNVKCVLSSKDIQYKIKSTIKTKYNVDNIMQVEAVKQKAKVQIVETCMGKYNVAYPCLIDNCQKASPGSKSKPNLDFDERLTLAGIKHKCEYSIGKRSYDFNVGNILIEINPSATHNSTWGIKNDTGLSSNYHYEKTKLAKVNGLRCIHVWDWDNKDAVIALLKLKDTIDGKDCALKEVTDLRAEEFLAEYHLQGSIKANIRLGLYYNNVLVSIMVFNDLGHNKYDLVRYCSSKNVINDTKILFNYFLETYKPASIISYCDNSKFDDTFYNMLGFTLKYYGEPQKHWYNIKTKEHIIENGSLNKELMLQNKFVEIYDCGQSLYEYLVDQV